MYFKCILAHLKQIVNTIGQLSFSKKEKSASKKTGGDPSFSAKAAGIGYIVGDLCGSPSTGASQLLINSEEEPSNYNPIISLNESNVNAEEFRLCSYSPHS